MRLAQGPVPLVAISNSEIDARLFEGNLSAFGCRGVVPPSVHEYGPIFDACCEALAPLIEPLSRRGLNLFLLLTSADLSPEKWAGYPAFDLAKQMRDLRVVEGRGIEGAFSRHGKVRYAGLYQLATSSFCSACRSQNGQSLAFLSCRTDVLSDRFLAEVFHAADFYAGDEKPGEFKVLRHAELNVLGLASLLCPAGDVVVKTDGAFDDKYRSVNLVYDPRGPNAGVFADAMARLTPS